MAKQAPPRRATYTPDYQALIQQDPAFAALQQQLSAQGTSDAAQRQAATEQALIQFGEIPNFAAVASQLGLSPEALAMLQQDIDPNASALARANTAAGLSTEAGLQQGQDQAIHSLRNALAAHGALSSGDDAYRTNLQDQSYAKAQSDALSQLLASIGGYQQQYLTSQQNANQQRQQGLQAAEQFESGLPQNQGFTLHYDVQHGVYRDASGNTYTPHRNHAGTWTLVNSATGAHYTLNSDGSLTSGSHAGQPPTQSPGALGGSPGGPQTWFGPPTAGGALGGPVAHPGAPTAGPPWAAGGALGGWNGGPTAPGGALGGPTAPPWSAGGALPPWAAPPHPGGALGTPGPIAPPHGALGPVAPHLGFATSAQGGDAQAPWHAPFGMPGGVPGPVGPGAQPVFAPHLIPPLPVPVV